jgi:hypothetical protein
MVQEVEFERDVSIEALAADRVFSVSVMSLFTRQDFRTPTLDSLYDCLSALGGDLENILSILPDAVLSPVSGVQPLADCSKYDFSSAYDWFRVVEQCQRKSCVPPF